MLKKRIEKLIHAFTVKPQHITPTERFYLLKRRLKVAADLFRWVRTSSGQYAWQGLLLTKLKIEIPYSSIQVLIFFKRMKLRFLYLSAYFLSVYFFWKKGEDVKALVLLVLLSNILLSSIIVKHYYLISRILSYSRDLVHVTILPI